jgi:hypothetical protein
VAAAMASSSTLLALSLFVFGASLEAIDVVMNVQASPVERHRGEARLTRLTPPPIRNQAQMLFEMSRMLTKFNMNVKRIDRYYRFR